MAWEKIRVMEFATLFLIGGTERHLSNLVRGIDSSEFELHIGCLKKVGAFLEEIERRRLPVSEYAINSLCNLTTLREQRRLARYLRANRIQVVHSYGFYSNVFVIPAARLAGTPAVVASIRDIGDIWTPMQRLVQKAVCLFADQVLVNAEAVRQQLIADGYRAGKIGVIRNGVNISGFSGHKKDGDAVRRELDIPPKAPLVAVFSRLNELKGIEFFLEAAAKIIREHDTVHFLIVGDSNPGAEAYRQSLEQYTAALGISARVRFTGFRLDVAELLSEIAISVLPSLSEGLSNVLLESMAAGVPIVATRVGGNPEVVEDGVTGILVPPRDAAGLASAISLLLRCPELGAQFGRAAEARAARYFSLETMVRETEQFYRQLLVRKCDTPLVSRARPA